MLSSCFSYCTCNRIAMAPANRPLESNAGKRSMALCLAVKSPSRRARRSANGGASRPSQRTSNSILSPWTNSVYNTAPITSATNTSRCANGGKLKTRASAMAPRSPPQKMTALYETVVKTPGLSSPCTMECGEGLLTAFGVGFTPHIQGQAGTDLRLRPHPVDTLVHLAIAPVAPLHRIRGGGQQCVVKKRQGLVQRRGKELFEGGAHLWEPQEPTPQYGQCGQRGLGPTAPIA